MPEPLSDDQHTRLRELHARVKAQGFILGLNGHDRRFLLDALPALLAEVDRLRGIVRDVASEALPYDTVQTGYASSIYVCVFCEEQRHQTHDDTCPWRRAKEVFPDA